MKKIILSSLLLLTACTVCHLEAGHHRHKHKHQNHAPRVSLNIGHFAPAPVVVSAPVHVQRPTFVQATPVYVQQPTVVQATPVYVQQHAVAIPVTTYQQVSAPVVIHRPFFSGFNFFGFFFGL